MQKRHESVRRQHTIAKQKHPLTKLGNKCLFICHAAANATKVSKLAWPFHGPYRITAVHETGIEVRPVDCPQERSICVALNQA